MIHNNLVQTDRFFFLLCCAQSAVQFVKAPRSGERFGLGERDGRKEGENMRINETNKR